MGWLTGEPTRVGPYRRTPPRGRTHLPRSWDFRGKGFANAIGAGIARFPNAAQQGSLGQGGFRGHRSACYMERPRVMRMRVDVRCAFMGLGVAASAPAPDPQNDDLLCNFRAPVLCVSTGVINTQRATITTGPTTTCTRHARHTRPQCITRQTGWISRRNKQRGGREGGNASQNIRPACTPCRTAPRARRSHTEPIDGNRTPVPLDDRVAAGTTQSQR